MPNETTTVNINALFSQLQKSLECGPECQESEERERLQQKFRNAQTLVSSAPERLRVAQKNYITYTQGEGAYRDLIEEQLAKRADEVINKFKARKEKLIQNIKTQLETYNGLRINYKNIVDLYFKYKEENVMLTKQLKESVNDVLTNDRKTYYQDQEIDKLKMYYSYFILTVYVICVIFYVVYAFGYASKIDWKKRLGIFIVLIFLPFFSTYLLGLIIYVSHLIYGVIPKNVYKNGL